MQYLNLYSKMLNKLFFFIVYLFVFSFQCLYSYPSNSIYNLDSRVIDKVGNNVHISELHGKVHVFSMIYTKCKIICPVILSHMKEIEKRLPNNIAENVKFSLMTLNPDEDDYDTLIRFFFKNRLENNWEFYRTSKEETLKVASALGIKCKKEKNNEFIHSNSIIVIDKDGVVRLHHLGLDKEFDKIIDLIISLNN